MKLGSCKKIVRASTFIALVHSTADYCDPAWCRNNRTAFYLQLIYDALSLVTDCLRSTPANNLPVLVEKKTIGSPTKTSQDIFS